MSFHKDLPYLDHVLDAIKDMEESINNISKDDFINKKDIKDANIRRLEVVGGAVKKISVETKKKYPQIEWQKIAGLRDKIIHHYFGVDLIIVWNIIKKDIPILKKQIEKIKIGEKLIK